MSIPFLSRFRLSYCKTHLLPISLYSSQPNQITKNELGKVVNVAIIGAPNCGKSTLINNITERKICAASNKVHTTTRLIRAMCYYNDTQIIFLDTPGIVSEREHKKYKLPDSMIEAYHKSLRCADVVGVVHDISNRFTKDYLHPDVITMLNMVQDTPSFLIMNKVDKLKTKRQLLMTIRNLTNGFIAGKPVPGSEKHNTNKPNKGYSNFSDVFMVSALNGDGVADLRHYLVNNAKTGRLQYSPDDWTDQSPESLIQEAVRAKFLDFLQQELPYNLKIQMEYYEIDENDKIICSVCVECPSERIMKLINGAGGGRLQQIRSHVRNDLVELFKKTVVIDIHLKVKTKSLLDVETV